MLLIANGLHRIETRGFGGRINSEDQADGDGNEKRQCDGTEGDDGGPSGEPGDKSRDEKAEDDADGSAGEGDHGCLDHKLAHDVGLPGSNGAAQADFAGALEDTGQHDVHDADAAHEQRDGGDGHHDGVEEVLGALLLGEQLRGHNDGEVVGAVVGRIQERP